MLGNWRFCIPQKKLRWRRRAFVLWRRLRGSCGFPRVARTPLPGLGSEMGMRVSCGFPRVSRTPLPGLGSEIAKGEAGRNLEAGETELRPEEQALLKKICDAYYLPEWCSINDYKALFEKEGLLVTPAPFTCLPPPLAWRWRNSRVLHLTTTQRLEREPGDMRW